MELLEPLQNMLGGGTLSLWAIGGGLVALWLAMKMVKMAMRIAALAVGVGMLLSAAPWSGETIEGPAADCAVAAVTGAMNPYLQVVTKRLTVDGLTEDARCNADGSGLAAGGAEVKLRSFYDIAVQTWDVTPEGAAARDFEVPKINPSEFLRRGDQPGDDQPAQDE